MLSYLLNSRPIDLLKQTDDQGLLASARWAIKKKMWAVT
jgi:hypothetical protein